jgi:alpha-L-fucosidase
MYDTHLSDYSAVKMGPRRDVVAELKAAAKSHDLHFCLSSHRAEHDWFFDEGRKIPSDVSDPVHAGLYGPAQSRIVGPNSDELFSDYTYVSQYWLDDWLARQAELVERYSPELIYFDWWIGQPSFRNTLPKFLAYYYNFAARRGGSAVVNYKLGEFADGAGTLDIERGQAAEIRKDVWQTCTSISDKSWGFIENDTYKSVEQIVHLLADVVSKNGNLLLNVGPRAGGDIPGAARDTLLAVGRWLQVNGEAIYGSRPWKGFAVHDQTGPDLCDPAGPTGRCQIDDRFDPKRHRRQARQLAWDDFAGGLRADRRRTGAHLARRRATPARHCLSHRSLTSKAAGAKSNGPSCPMRAARPDRSAQSPGRHEMRPIRDWVVRN